MGHTGPYPLPSVVDASQLVPQLTSAQWPLFRVGNVFSFSPYFTPVFNSPTVCVSSFTSYFCNGDESYFCFCSLFIDLFRLLKPKPIDNRPGHRVLPPGHWRLKLEICLLFRANICKFDAEIKSYIDGETI